MSRSSQLVLQDISGEHLNRGSNKAQDARLDIPTRGFQERHQPAFFDVRVCHPNAVSYRNLEPLQIRIHENEKKRLYSMRVLDIEHAWNIYSSKGVSNRFRPITAQQKFSRPIRIKHTAHVTSMTSKLPNMGIKVT